MTGCVELHRRAGDPAVLPVPRSGQHQRQCRAVSERPPSGPGVPNHAHHEDTEAGSPFHRTTVTGIHAPAQLQGTVIGLALHCEAETHRHTHTHPFNGPLSGTTGVTRYQKGKTNLDFTEARDNEWQCHQLGHMQVCTSLQEDNHTNIPPLSFFQAGCASCRPTNSVKAQKAQW